MTSSESSTESRDLILVLNNCEDRLQLVLGECWVDNGELVGLTLAARQLSVAGKSGRFLIPSVESMLSEFGRFPAHVKRIACVVGPGSFTGIRIALSTVHGFAAGRRVLLAGLAYLPLLAAPLEDVTCSPFWVVVHARMGEVYAQRFSGGVPGLEVKAMTLEGLGSALAGESCFVLGSGVLRNKSFFTRLAGSNPSLEILPSAWNIPSPEAMFRQALKASFSEEMPQPTYMRPSDAERNLASIARKRGFSPEEAFRIMEEASS